MANVVYTKELLEKAVSECNTYADIARWFGKSPSGGTVNNIITRIKKFDIDTSHFLGKRSSKGKTPVNKLKPEDILIILPDKYSLRQGSHLLRRALIEIGVEYKCNWCKISEWQGKELILHVDHIDGNYLDNRRHNLRFLCPNCHSQTDTYCRRK